MATLANAYAREGTDFGVVDAAHPKGHRGADWKLGAGETIPAFERMVVVDSSRFSSVLGFCLVARLDDGMHVGLGHLRRGTRPNPGTILRPGESMGVVAAGPIPRVALSEPQAGADYPGTAWNGPHIHMTYSLSPNGIVLGQNLDPRPRVYESIRRISAAGGEIIPITNRPTGADNMPTANEITQELRNAVWLLGPNGEPLRVEQALKDIAARQAQIIALEVGYGRRIEDVHLNLIPALLRAAADDTTELVLSDEQASEIAQAIAATGLLAKLDPESFARIATAVADEDDRRDRVRLGA